MIAKTVLKDIDVSVTGDSFVSVRVLCSPVLTSYTLRCEVNITTIVAAFSFACYSGDYKKKKKKKIVYIEFYGTCADMAKDVDNYMLTKYHYKK